MFGCRGSGKDREGTLTVTRLSFVVESAGLGEWEELLSRCPCATFFHSPSWVEAICAAFPGYSNATCIARSSDGRRAILPLVQSWEGKRSGLRGLESVPPYCYGGPIFEGTPDPDFIASATLAIVESSTVRAQEVLLHGNPYFALSIPGLRAVTGSETQIVCLSGGYGEVKKRYKTRHKSTLTKPKLSAITTTVGDCCNDWKEYFDLYQKSLQRWGENATSNHPWSVFDRLRQAGPNVRLWLAKANGITCSGAIVLYQFPRAFYWHGAFDSNYSKLSPNNILHDAIIHDACDAGYEAYDLLSSGSHVGVASFKDSLGATRVPIVGYEWKASFSTRLMGATRKLLT